MDDNATCYRTLAVQDCLDSEGIERLVWLARSPDLNPIENVWDALGRQVAGRNYPPTNKNTLFRALTEEWDKLPQQLLDNVVQSMVNTRLSFGARAAGAHYRLFRFWTWVPVLLDKQLSGRTAGDEIASESVDCRFTYVRIPLGSGIDSFGHTNEKTFGEKWTAPDVLKGLEKPKEEKREKDRKRQGLVVFGKRKRRHLGVLDRDAEDESWTWIRKAPCGLYRDKLWRERLEKGATILARHRDNLILNLI
ncbi:transposable element Tcb2 transposase [Trichonephila clavipes]|nr:transposable element Tcb2 transposase [Trichonephila clavipes]